MSDHADYQEKAIHRVSAAIEAIKAGRMVIMTDDESRENEGDLIFAAVDVTPAKINFMAKEARGLICLTLEAATVDRLQLPLMADHSKSRTPMQTAFTVSIEAKNGVTTGISAADRAHTVQVAINDESGPDDLVVPGHVFPLRAKSGGVLERAGHTEGSIDLMRFARKKPAAVICEIMNDDGTMARRVDLEKFAARHGLAIVSIADLITFRLLRESLVEEIGRRPFATPFGTYEGVWFRNQVDHNVHFALVKGSKFNAEQCVDVRVHKQRPLTDVFSSDLYRTDKKMNRWTIEYGLKLLQQSEHAVLVYLMQDRPEAAMIEQLEDVQRPMDPRLYGIGAQILKALGVARMRLHVGSERSLVGLAGFGLEITAMELMKPNDAEDLL